MNKTNNDSKLLYMQARYQFEKAMEEFENNTIKNEPQLIQTVFQSFESFFTSMGKPHMIPIYAYPEGPLWSDDYNLMMNQVKEDLTTLFQEIDILGRSLYTDFNHNVMQNDMIEEEYKRIFDKLKDLEMYTGISSQGILRFGRDDFLNGFKIDYDRIAGKPLEITDTGVSLPIKGDYKNVAEDAKITIVPGNQTHNDYILGSDSNGFPGNNNEISMISDDLLTGTSGYEFIGKDDNHGNYGAIIDGDANTWFEYERINLREHEKRKITKNLGWEYVVHGNKRLSFAEDPEDGTLKLHLQIILNKEETINKINVNMYTPPNYGSQAAIVKNILVSEEGGSPVSILDKAKQDTDYSFHFDPIKAKVISILFEQKNRYYTDLGHIFYQKKMNVTNQHDYVFETLTHKTKEEFAPRLEGPLINLESLGVQVDVHETNVQAFYPVKGKEKTGYAMSEITRSLLSEVDDSTIDAGVERFEGWRYCIGIRDIEILSVEYENMGELVTKPYFFDRPIERISISANEVIGSLLSKNMQDKYNWIRYYVTIDDGKNWHPITPLEHETLENMPPKLYTIQQVESNEFMLEERYGYLEATTPIFSLRLRIVMERPDDRQTYNIMRTSSQDNISSLYRSSNLKRFTFHVETEPLEEHSESYQYQIDHVDDYTPLPPDLDPDELPEEIPPIDDEDEPATGIPPGSGGEEGPPDPITVEITNKTSRVCQDEELVITGRAVSVRPIEKLELWINQTLIETRNITSGESQEIFEWKIPYQTISNLGLSLGDLISIKITGEDEVSFDSDIFSATIQECTEEKADCYELLSVLVYYYNEYHNEIREIELDKNILPYEFDNGEGTLVTVGWNARLKAPTIMITGGYHEGNNAFVLHAVGIRYIDFDYNMKLKWGYNISESSEGIINPNLIPGNPNEKSASWLEDIKDGNYETSPSLNRINDWLTISLDNEWMSNHCPITLDFDPEEFKQPNQPSDEDLSDQYECIELIKIFIQYYNTNTKQLKMKQIDLDEAYKVSYPFKANLGGIVASVGWYNNFQGVTIGIKEKETEPLAIAAVGMLMRNKKGTLVTEWSESTVIKTTDIENDTLMYGSKKVKAALNWIDGSHNIIEQNAPVLKKITSAIVLGFQENLVDQMCVVKKPIDDEADVPKFDLIPPVIEFDFSTIPDPFFYHNLSGNDFILTIDVTDETEMGRWSVRSWNGQWGETVPEGEKRTTIDIRIPINMPDPIEVISSNKTDIIFIVDTSGSMSDEIQDVRNNMSSFISYLQNNDIDARIGYAGSRYSSGQLRTELKPASQFNFDISLNSGSWEALNWRQITDTAYGAASFYNQLRSDAKTHVIMLTDTYVSGILPDSVIQEMEQRKISVSTIYEFADNEPDYEKLANATNGMTLNIKDPNFHQGMQELAEDIVSSTQYYPDTSQVIIIDVYDRAGNLTKQEVVLNLTDY